MPQWFRAPSRGAFSFPPKDQKMTDQSKTRPIRTRDVVSNGNRIHSRGGVDGRTKAARRFRDLIDAFTAEIGGGDLSEADKALVRACASLAQRCEVMQADSVSGKAVDDEQLVRISNVLARTLAQLQARANKAKPKPSMADYLAKTYGGAK
jgi:hypothetical protein